VILNKSKVAIFRCSKYVGFASDAGGGSSLQ
jgi:hypothetical protein